MLRCQGQPRSGRVKKPKIAIEFLFEHGIVVHGTLEGVAKTMDMFLFACYTGLRYSDMQALEAKEIRKPPEGWYMERYQVKTRQNVIVPLIPAAIKIYEKYMKLHFQAITGKLFPPITNQKVNAYLKEIADVCRIGRELTFHMARHTCGTLLISNKVSLAVTSKILGHSSIRTTEIYAKITERSIWDDMKLIDAKLKETEGGKGTKGKE